MKCFFFSNDEIPNFLNAAQQILTHLELID